MEPLKPSRSAASTAAAPTAAVEGHSLERAPATTARSANTQNVIATRTVENATSASASARTSPIAMRTLTPAANRPPPKPAPQQPTQSSRATPDPKPARTVEPALSNQPVPRPKLATLSDAASAPGTSSHQIPARPQRGAAAAELTAAPNSPRKPEAEGQRPQAPNATAAATAPIRAPRPQTPSATIAAAAPVQVPRPQTTSATNAAATPIQVPRPQTANATTAAATIRVPRPQTTSATNATVASIAKNSSSQLNATNPAFQRTKLSSSADLTAGSSADSIPSPFDAAAAAFPHTEASSSIDVTDSMLLNSKPSAIDVTDSMLLNSKPSAIDVTDSMLLNSKPSAIDVTDSMLLNSKPSSSDAVDEEFSVDEATSSINVTDAMIVGSKPSHAGAVPSMPFLELQSDEELETIKNDPVIDPPPSTIGLMLEDGSVALPHSGLIDAVATQSPSGARSSDHELTPSASTFAPRDLTDQSTRLGAFASKKAFLLRTAIIAGVVSLGGLVGIFVYSGRFNDDSASSIQAAATPSKPDIKASPHAEPATPRPGDVTAPQKTNQEIPGPVAPEVTQAAPSADGKAQLIADAAPKPSGDDSAKSVDSPTIPDYVNKPTLLFVSDVAVRRSQRCHPQGHAVGTAQLFVTFSPNGRVSDARLEGEPLASAPVAKCILSHARAIQMPKFKGPAFTHVISVTLR